MPEYQIVVKISIAADSQGEALHAIEKRVRANGTAEAVPARVVETVSIKQGHK